MGAWGTGSFENDDALDFVATVETEGWAVVLEQLHDAEDNIELGAGAASCALAAAEIVAAALGAASEDFPEKLGAREWSTDEEHVALAVRVVRRIATDSELSDLWGESASDLEAWATVVEDLLKRLRADEL